MATITRRTKSFDSSGLPTETVTTLTIACIQKSTGEADAYARLGLTRSEAPLLVGTPSNYSGDEDDLPRPGDEIEWPTGGPTYLIRSARHVTPDGNGDVLCYLIIGRGG